MTIAGDLQGILARSLERDASDMDGLVREACDFLVDGEAIGWLAHEISAAEFDGYITAVTKLRSKILPK